MTAKQLKINSNQVFIFETAQQLVRDLAIKLHDYAAEKAQQHRQFYLSLAGGTTPKQLYTCLATDASFDRQLWQHFEIFFGDERYVPHTSADSNYKMAKEAWLDHVSIPAQQIHPIPTHCQKSEDCALAYAQAMNFLPMVNGLPCFDVILLGMGDDGHTASLFPNTPVLQQTQKWVDSVYVAKHDSQRITFTYPLINNAQQIFVLVTGESKAAMLKRVFYEPKANLPIQQIENRAGLTWFLDAAAAAELI